MSDAPAAFFVGHATHPEWTGAFALVAAQLDAQLAEHRGSARAAHEFQRAMWLFYRKHYAATTPAPVGALVQLGLALRGGPALAREMWRPGAGRP